MLGAVAELTVKEGSQAEFEAARAGAGGGRQRQRAGRALLQAVQGAGRHDQVHLHGTVQGRRRRRGPSRLRALQAPWPAWARSSMAPPKVTRMDKVQTESDGSRIHHRGTEVPRRSPRLDRRELHRRSQEAHGADQERLAGREAPEGLAEEAGREGLARHQLADRAWRPRLEPDAEIHLRDGDVARRRPAHELDGRAHVRARHHEVRHGRAEEEIPAADPQLGCLVVPGLFRAGLGLRPRQPLDERQARRRLTTSSTAPRRGRPTPSGPTGSSASSAPRRKTRSRTASPSSSST